MGFVCDLDAAGCIEHGLDTLAPNSQSSDSFSWMLDRVVPSEPWGLEWGTDRAVHCEKATVWADRVPRARDWKLPDTAAGALSPG